VFVCRITQVDVFHFRGEDIQVETTGMGGHLFNQIETGNSVGKAWIVIDPVRKEHLPARGSFFDHDMIESCPRCIESGR